MNAYQWAGLILLVAWLYTVWMVIHGHFLLKKEMKEHPERFERDVVTGELKGRDIW